MSERPRGLKDLSVQFWLFWVGQMLSNLGRAFSAFAFPLLVYKISGTPISLALIPVALFAPQLLFGLIIGTWSDRVDRKRLMISADVARFVVIAATGAIGLAGGLQAWMLYAAAFITATLDIAFESAEFAAIPSLIPPDKGFVAANSRMMAGYNIGTVAGPVLAGLLVLATPLAGALLVDAGTYLFSAASLMLVSVSFNAVGRRRAVQLASTFWSDMKDGLRYVFSSPTLRNISLLATLSQFFGGSATAVLVLFAIRDLHASPSKISVFYAAEGVGVILLSLIAALVSRRLGPRNSMLLSMLLRGALLAGFALSRSYYLSVPIWGLASALAYFFSIHSTSLRQEIVPKEMLGRAASVARLLAYSANPVGSVVGAGIMELLPVWMVYLYIGISIMLVPVIFQVLHGVIERPAAARIPEGDMQPIAPA